jgi:quinol monooxygenase YgiN
MLIVAGHLVVNPTERDAYVADCVSVVEAARSALGCLDFSVTPDTVDTSRICIYERWENEGQLLVFRGAGPSATQQTAIVSADVKRYEISSVAEA